MPQAAQMATRADSLRHAKLRYAGGPGGKAGTLPIA